MTPSDEATKTCRSCAMAIPAKAARDLWWWAGLILLAIVFTFLCGLFIRDYAGEISYLESRDLSMGDAPLLLVGIGVNVVITPLLVLVAVWRRTMAPLALGLCASLVMNLALSAITLGLPYY